MINTILGIVAAMFFITLLSFLAACFYFLYRSAHVSSFRAILIDIDCKYDTDLLDKCSYEEMLFRFKPLKLEYWFTEDELRGIEEK